MDGGRESEVRESDVQGELLKQIDSVNPLWTDMILAGVCRVSE